MGSFHSMMQTPSVGSSPPYPYCLLSTVSPVELTFMKPPFAQSKSPNDVGSPGALSASTHFSPRDSRVLKRMSPIRSAPRSYFGLKLNFP